MPAKSQPRERLLLVKANLTCPIIEVFDHEFHPSKWDSSHSILHIPGALSTALDTHLGEKIAEIKQFVQKGGKFLGWCGGGYWACRKVEYQDVKENFVKERDLALWKGEEKGPFLPSLGNPEGTIGFFHGAVKIAWKGSALLQKYFCNGLELKALLSGGGSFIPSQEEYPYEVLATYYHGCLKPLATVKTKVDQGISILVNPYFTHGPDYLRAGLSGYQQHFPEHPWQQIVDDLEDSEKKSLLCFTDMLYELTQTERDSR